MVKIGLVSGLYSVCIRPIAGNGLAFGVLGVYLTCGYNLLTNKGLLNDKPRLLIKVKFFVLLISILLPSTSFAEALIRHKEYEFASIQFLIEQEIGRIVLPQIYRNIGIEIGITPFPGERAQLEANQGNKDGEIMRIWSYGDENDQSVRVPTPYYYLETVAFSLTKNKLSVESREDLKKYKLAIIRGVKHTNNITRGLTNVYVMNSTESMFKMLLNEKVDIVLTNSLDGEVVLKRLGLEHKVTGAKPLATLPLYHYINQKNRNLVPLINAEILRIRNNGVLDNMISQAEQIVIAKN